MTQAFFAVCLPGLESFTQAELAGLGLEARLPKAETVAGEPAEEAGGLEFSGELPDLYRANLHLRTANRILLRLGDFHAEAFAELRKKAARLPWELYLRPGQPVALRVTCRKSKLYHSDAVAERVASAISDRLGRPTPAVRFDETAGSKMPGVLPGAKIPGVLPGSKMPSVLPGAKMPGALPGSKTPGALPGAPPQLVAVRLLHDHCTISIDSSGALLHRRGYRLETAKAPLRETLAAGLLLASGWDGQAPLLDPFCGSGTIPIEAALLARHIAPGKNRRFAFMDWPGFDAAAWQAMHGQAVAAEIPTPAVIQASDRDAGAIRIASANAERAGVAGDIAFSPRAVSAIEPPRGPGWLVTNPPYGVRVSPAHDLRNLYAQLGNVLRALLPGWQAGILCANDFLIGHTGLKFETALPLVNGGIRVKFYLGKVPPASRRPAQR